MKQQTTKYSTRPTSDDPRDTEAWALTEAARRLIDASRCPKDPNMLQEALQINQKLWTIFQVSISEEDCPLPIDLRHNIAALSLLVDRETVQRLVDLDATKLDKLIQVNRSVASGLTQRAGNDHPQIPSVPDDAEPPKPGQIERVRISI
ncbi:flagellar protein FlaF [Azospirillaceae bacterium]